MEPLLPLKQEPHSYGQINMHMLQRILIGCSYCWNMCTHVTYTPPHTYTHNFHHTHTISMERNILFSHRSDRRKTHPQERQPLGKVISQVSKGMPGVTPKAGHSEIMVFIHSPVCSFCLWRLRATYGAGHGNGSQNNVVNQLGVGRFL